jgi:predicted transcriptional regulator
LASLDGGNAAPVSKRPARKPRRRRAKRAARGERRSQFLSAVRANPKASITEIGKQMGVSTNQAAGLARSLEASGEIKRSKRGIRLTAKATAS